MNDLVYNNMGRPLFVQNSDSLQTASLAGNAYVTTANLTTLLSAAGGSALILTNPAGSGKNIFIYYINIVNLGTTVIGKVELYKNATMSGGTIATTTNLNFGSSNVTVAQNKYNSTSVSLPISGGTVIATITQVASLYRSLLQDLITIPPGNSIAILTYSVLSVGLQEEAEICYWESAI